MLGVELTKVPLALQVVASEVDESVASRRGIVWIRAHFSREDLSGIEVATADAEQDVEEEGTVVLRATVRFQHELVVELAFVHKSCARERSAHAEPV